MHICVCMLYVYVMSLCYVFDVCVLCTLCVYIRIHMHTYVHTCMHEDDGDGAIPIHAACRNTLRIHTRANYKGST